MSCATSEPAHHLQYAPHRHLLAEIEEQAALKLRGVALLRHARMAVQPGASGRTTRVIHHRASRLQAISSLLYAAARVTDVPELVAIKSLLASKFGKEYAAEASSEHLCRKWHVNDNLIRRVSSFVVSCQFCWAHMLCS